MFDICVHRVRLDRPLCRPLRPSSQIDSQPALLQSRTTFMEHPAVIKPADHAQWRPDKMGKSTIYASERFLVGLNAFEPGQSHALHAHVGMDKLYYVLDGEGVFIL